MKLPIKYLRACKPLVRDAEWHRLKEDLALLGQTNPLLVRKLKDDMFEVIDGNKRLSCAFCLDWDDINCEII